MNCDCNIVLTCKVKNLWVYLSLKATLEFVFLFILWNLTKTINRGFYSRFTNNCNYIDSKFFFRIWGFRGIGNIWGGILFLRESVTDARIGQTFIQLDKDCCWVDGKETILSKNSPAHEAVEGLFGFYFFRLEVRGWNKSKKGVAYSNILWMMSESFSHDGVLDSYVILRNETNQGKARCLYIGSHEGSWLNWKETRRGFDQVKHVSSRACKPMGMETET